CWWLRDFVEHILIILTFEQSSSCPHAIILVAIPIWEVLAVWPVDRHNQGMLLGRLSRRQALRVLVSRANMFTNSNVKIQISPACAGGVSVTSSPRMSDVRSSNSGTAIGYALLMNSNKSETRLQWCGLTRTTTGGQEDDCPNEGLNLSLFFSRSTCNRLGCRLLVYQPMIISYRAICFPQSAKGFIGLGLSKVTVSDVFACHCWSSAHL
ncbi:hypothetical protein T265_12966, partial [Opisthorchis viverrini]